MKSKTKKLLAKSLNLESFGSLSSNYKKFVEAVLSKGRKKILRHYWQWSVEENINSNGLVNNGSFCQGYQAVPMNAKDIFLGVNILPFTNHISRFILVAILFSRLRNGQIIFV